MGEAIDVVAIAGSFSTSGVAAGSSDSSDSSSLCGLCRRMRVLELLLLGRIWTVGRVSGRQLLGTVGGISAAAAAAAAADVGVDVGVGGQW